MLRVAEEREGGNMDLEKLHERVKALFACDERELRRGARFAAVAYTVLLFWALWLKFNDFHMVVPNYHWLSTMSVKERFLYDLIPFQIRFDFTNQFLGKDRAPVLGTDVDGVTSATYSSRAVTAAVAEAMAQLQTITKGV